MPLMKTTIRWNLHLSILLLIAADACVWKFLNSVRTPILYFFMSSLNDKDSLLIFLCKALVIKVLKDEEVWSTRRVLFAGLALSTMFETLCVD